MKFFHIADVHLGASPDVGFPWGEKRKEEIWNSFKRILERAEAEQIDLLLIAGDLFHRQPLLRELKEVNYLFSKLTKTQVAIIAGNHDYLKKDSYSFGFKWEHNVIFLSSQNCQKVTFDEFGTCVYGLSYQTREIREPLYNDLRPVEGNGMFQILLAHGGDEKHIPIDKRKLQFSGFDYIALGHIHKPQILIKDQIAYAGAPEPLDKNDLGPHGFISGSYQNGQVSIAFIPFAERSYIALEIPVDERQTDFSLQEKIQSLIKENGVQNIYKIKLTGYRDADIVFHTDHYMRYGNIIEVVDESIPAYDLEVLLRQNQDNIIGRYIEKLYHPAMSKVEEKALYYGIQALLETKA